MKLENEVNEPQKPVARPMNRGIVFLTFVWLAYARPSWDSESSWVGEKE